MKFLKVRTINAQGNPGEPYWVKPKEIKGVVVVMVEGELKGPAGDPIFTRKAGLDLGMKVIPIDMTPEEAIKLLENWGR